MGVTSHSGKCTQQTAAMRDTAHSGKCTQQTAAMGTLLIVVSVHSRQQL